MGKWNTWKKATLPKIWKEEVLLERLNNIDRLCTLENASFAGGSGSPVETYPTKESEVDEFIKGRIRIYMTNITLETELIKDTIK